MCGNCQKHVHDILSKIDSVKDVEVSLEKEEAQFSFDKSITNIEKLKEAFKDTLYELE